MFLTPGPAPFLVNVLKTHGHHGSQQQSILCHTITHTKQLTQLLTSSAALLAACHSGLLPGASTAASLCSVKSPDHFTYFKAWTCSGASTVASTGQCTALKHMLGPAHMSKKTRLCEGESSRSLLNHRDSRRTVREGLSSLAKRKEHSVRVASSLLRWSTAESRELEICLHSQRICHKIFPSSWIYFLSHSE